MKISEKLKKIDIHNPKFQGMMVFIVLAVFGAYMFHLKVIKVQENELNGLKSKHQQKENELINIISMRPKLDALRKSMDELNVQLQMLRSKFPDTEEIPQIIREITTVSRKVGIATIRFIPQKSVEREYYCENNYLMSVVGSYHNLGRFFAELANFDLIVNLSKVSIRTNPGVQQSILLNEEHESGVETITASFNLTTFSSKK